VKRIEQVVIGRPPVPLDSNKTQREEQWRDED
jgi:hypothetical protein